MLRLLTISFIVVSSSFVWSQPPINSCPLDTSALFEITLTYHQFTDSLGDVITKIYPGSATPHWYLPEAFTDLKNGEPCTPFILEFEEDNIYVYDSTGHYPNTAHKDSAKRFILNQNNIASLRIYIVNETKETVKLNKIPLFKKLNLRVRYLDINCSCHYYESKVEIDAKNWQFLQPDFLYEVKIYVPLKESKETLFHHLGRYRALEHIEFQNQYKGK